MRNRRRCALSKQNLPDERERAKFPTENRALLQQRRMVKCDKNRHAPTNKTTRTERTGNGVCNKPSSRQESSQDWCEVRQSRVSKSSTTPPERATSPSDGRPINCATRSHSQRPHGNPEAHEMHAHSLATNRSTNFHPSRQRTRPPQRQLRIALRHRGTSGSHPRLRRPRVNCG